MPYKFGRMYFLTLEGKGFRGLWYQPKWPRVVVANVVIHKLRNLATHFAFIIVFIHLFLFQFGSGDVPSSEQRADEGEAA